MNNFSFRQNDPLNSLVIETDSGLPLYEIDTPLNLLSKGMTTIRRIDSSGVSVTSQIDWYRLGEDMVNVDPMGGSGWLEVSSFLAQPGIFTSSRVFVAPDGAEYKWKTESNKFFLINRQTQTLVAQSHRQKLGFFSGKPQCMNLDVAPEALPFLDTVILTFVIMEQKRRDRQRAVSNRSMTTNNSTMFSGGAGPIGGSGGGGGVGGF